jgi:hypothetical protein
LPKAISCSSNATAKRSNCCPKHQRSFSAKVSKAEFSFVMRTPEKSTR